VDKKKPGSLRVPGCSEKLARLYLPGTSSGPKVKAVKPAAMIGCHVLLLLLFCLKKQKTADIVLRSTGRFHTKLDSLPVNLHKPKVKVIAAGKHCFAPERYSRLDTFILLTLASLVGLSQHLSR
jgi:hypothetical protein